MVPQNCVYREISPEAQGVAEAVTEAKSIPWAGRWLSMAGSGREAKGSETLMREVVRGTVYIATQNHPH